MATIWASILNGVRTLWDVIGIGKAITNPTTPTVLSKDVIEKLTQPPYGLTRNEIDDIRHWWREGVDALNAARNDNAFSVGEQIDAEVVVNNGDFGDPERVLQFAEAAQDTAGDHQARVRRCIAVGLANTDKDFAVLRGRVFLAKLAGSGSGAAWRWARANAQPIWNDWLWPLLRLELIFIGVMLGLWAVSFTVLLVCWFWAESHGRFGVGYILTLLAFLSMLFTFTVPVQIIDGNLTVLGAPVRAIRKIMKEAGLGEEQEPGGKELRWGLHMIYHFRWRAVLGMLIASVFNHILMGMFGAHPEIWWLTFGSLMLGIAVSVILQQERRTDDPAAKSYYRWSRIGLTALFSLLMVVVITRLGIHGDLSSDGSWLVRTGLEVARVPLRYSYFQSVTAAMAGATALGAILALAFKKWGPAAGLVLAAVVASGVVSCSTHYAPPAAPPAPISAWEDPAESPLHNGDIAGPTPATATAPPASPTTRTASAYSDRRARAEALRERARK